MILARGPDGRAVARISTRPARVLDPAPAALVDLVARLGEGPLLWNHVVEEEGLLGPVRRRVSTWVQPDEAGWARALRQALDAHPEMERLGLWFDWEDA